MRLLKHSCSFTKCAFFFEKLQMLSCLAFLEFYIVEIQAILDFFKIFQIADKTCF